eukprot:gene6124-6828_t
MDFDKDCVEYEDKEERAFGIEEEQKINVEEIKRKGKKRLSRKNKNRTEDNQEENEIEEMCEGKEEKNGSVDDLSLENSKNEIDEFKMKQKMKEKIEVHNDKDDDVKERKNDEDDDGKRMNEDEEEFETIIERSKEEVSNNEITREINTRQDHEKDGKEMNEIEKGKEQIGKMIEQPKQDENLNENKALTDEQDEEQIKENMNNEQVDSESVNDAIAANDDDESIYQSLKSFDESTDEIESDYQSVKSDNICGMEYLDMEGLPSLGASIETKQHHDNEADISEEDYTTADESMKDHFDDGEEEHAIEHEDDVSTVVDVEEVLVLDDDVEEERVELEIEKKEQEKKNHTKEENVEKDNEGDKKEATDHSPKFTNVKDEDAPQSGEQLVKCEEVKKPDQKRRKSFFSTIMAKKELKVKMKIKEFRTREETAKDGTVKAMARIAEAKSKLPLMIVEQRIPKTELSEKLQSRLDGLEKRLEVLNIYNSRVNDFIQNWRTLEGEVRERKNELQMKMKQTSDKQRRLGAIKKKKTFIETKIMRNEERQTNAERRMKTLSDKKDMLLLRLKERRNIVNRCIDGAKKCYELCIKQATKVVAVTRKYEELKEREKFLEDEIFKKKKLLAKMKKDFSCKKFDLERTQVQRSVKAMKKERGW